MAQVEIADDFYPPKDSDEQDEHGNPLPGPIDDADARLAYVVVTRARLDLGGLTWINKHPDGNPGGRGLVDEQRHGRDRLRVPDHL
jgi:hypothetical protein